MLPGPALDRALLSDCVVGRNVGSHKVVQCQIVSSGWKWAGPGKDGAGVRVVTQRVPLGPRPDVPVGKNLGIFF